MRIVKKPIIKLGPRVSTKRTAYIFFLFKKILISKVIKILKRKTVESQRTNCVYIFDKRKS